MHPSGIKRHTMHKTNYYLEFQNSKRDFHLTIPPNTNRCGSTQIPDWARLACHQCSNCPLNAKDTEYCPAALDMIDLAERFSHSNSYDTVTMHVWTYGEMHTIRTDLQRALSYIYLAIVAHSSCPHAALLAPVMKFGKMFIDFDDAIFYALSMKLVSAYLNEDEKNPGKAKVPPLDGPRILSIVFTGLLARVKESSMLDANINALVKDIQWAYAVQNPERFIKSIMAKYFVASPQLQNDGSAQKA